MTRQFTATTGKRSRVPLLIGIAGPSGSGKTFSALRLARGIQRVTPGPIHGIDTEAGRMLHYAHDDKCGGPGACQLADHFTFEHVPFAPPFGCLDYLEAIRFCMSRGSSTIVIDSASHLHEGEGGMLDQHEQAIDKATRNSADWAERDRASWRCWKQPKADMNRFVQCLLQMNINLIFCFRAKEKMAPGKDESGKKALVSRGTMAIADDSLIYEMTVQPLLEAGSRGVPNWSPTEAGSRLQTKLPGFFSSILKRPGQPLDEDMGEMMGRWAAGDVPAVQRSEAKPREQAASPNTTDLGEVLYRVQTALTLADVEALSASIQGAQRQWSDDDKKRVREAFRVRRQELAP